MSEPKNLLTPKMGKVPKTIILLLLFFSIGYTRDQTNAQTKQHDFNRFKVIVIAFHVFFDCAKFVSIDLCQSRSLSSSPISY